MRITKARWIAVCLVCLTALAGVFAGCGQKGVRQGEPVAEGQREKGQDTLTISAFNNLIPPGFYDVFSEKYPDVKLEIISYAGINGSGYALNSLKNGDIPDIYLSTQNFSRESQEKYLLDLSGYDFVNNYSSGLLDSLEVNGSIYLLPAGYQLIGIYYNRTILEENGWAVPQSFEELLELSGQIEAAGYRTMGHGMSLQGYPFNYFFNIGNTGYFGTPQGAEWKREFPKGETRAAGNSGLEETIDYFNRWVENGFITTEDMSKTQFMEGECVFYLCLGLSQYEYTTEEGTTYEFGILPWLSEDGSDNMLTRNVGVYLGLSRALEEEGEEQKLSDALKFMEYISTAEGQRALMAGNGYYMSSLNEEELSADSPYHEVAGLVKEGRTVPLVYVGWEKQIVPIAEDIRLLIEGKITPQELSALFDSTNDDIRNGSSDDVCAVADRTMTIEETARLTAIAEGKAVSADCALISTNEYHGEGKTNQQGLAWYLYEGEISSDIITMIRPRSDTISVLNMTGAEIKAMQEAGFDLNGDGNPYPYLLFVKGDGGLSDEEVYTLAVSSGELTEEMAAKAMQTEISPAEAIETYLRELGTVHPDELSWK